MGINLIFMARPERNNVDYFPFLCKEGKAMFYIEHKYGNDGYASWVKILRQLAVTNYHYLNLSNKTEFMYLSSKCNIPEQKLNEIINDLCELGEFNKNLWDKYKVIFNEKLVKSISDAYFKRNNKCITFEGLLLLLDDLGVSKRSYLQLNDTGNTQTKVNNTKVNNTKVNLDDRKLKFAESLNGFLEKYGRETLNDFYKYWTEPNRSETKLKFELQKTWDLSRRLERWANNDFNKINNGAGKKSTIGAVNDYIERNS